MALDLEVAQWQAHGGGRACGVRAPSETHRGRKALSVRFIVSRQRGFVFFFGLKAFGSLADFVSLAVWVQLLRGKLIRTKPEPFLDGEGRPTGNGLGEGPNLKIIPIASPKVR